MIEEATKNKNIKIVNIDPSPKNNWHPTFKTGRYVTQQGYILVLKHDHPNKTKEGYMMEHRLVMEQHLGRYLTSEEEVHHINGIKSDNRIENLQLISPSDHMKLHLKGNKRGKANKKDMTGRFCKLCGSTRTYITKNGWADWAIYKDGFLCRVCKKKIEYIQKEIRTKLF